MVLLPLTDEVVLAQAGQCCRMVQWGLGWGPFCGGSELFVLPSSYFLSFPIHRHLLSSGALVAIYANTPVLQLKHVEGN